MRTSAEESHNACSRSACSPGAFRLLDQPFSTDLGGEEKAVSKRVIRGPS